MTGSSLPRTRIARQVAREFVQRLVFFFGVLVGHALPAAHLRQSIENRFVRHAVALQQAAGEALVVAHADEQMLGRNVFVFQLAHRFVGCADDAAVAVAIAARQTSTQRAPAFHTHLLRATRQFLLGFAQHRAGVAFQLFARVAWLCLRSAAKAPAANAPRQFPGDCIGPPAIAPFAAPRPPSLSIC
jgi:hypothetical protein